MSLLLLQNVIEHAPADLSKTEFMTLIALAWKASKLTGRWWTRDIEALRVLARCSLASLYRALEELEGRDLITCELPGSGRDGRKLYFHVHLTGMSLNSHSENSPRAEFSNQRPEFSPREFSSTPLSVLDPDKHSERSKDIDAKGLWADALAHLELQVNRGSFNSWLRSTTNAYMDTEGGLHIQCADRFTVAQIRATGIEALTRKVLGKLAGVDIQPFFECAFSAASAPAVDATLTPPAGTAAAGG